VAVNRGSAILAAPGSVGGPRTLVEDLDLAGSTSFLSRGCSTAFAGDLSGLSEAEIQGLAAGQRETQGPLSLVADGFDRRLLVMTGLRSRATEIVGRFVPAHSDICCVTMDVSAN
jgi:hypothetical protein